LIKKAVALGTQIKARATQGRIMKRTLKGLSHLAMARIMNKSAAEKIHLRVRARRSSLRP
jgi:hypothetical protein